MMTGDEKDGTSQKSNPRYRTVWNLRERVWHKIGWPIPSNKAVQGRPQADTAMQGTNEEASSTAALENHPPQYADGVEDSTMAAALDNLLNGDPMDMLKWDEWESITAGFFVT